MKKLLDIIQRVHGINIIVNDTLLKVDKYEARKEVFWRWWLYFLVIIKQWDEQSDFYNKSFEFFAKELTEKLDEHKNSKFLGSIQISRRSKNSCKKNDLNKK